MSLKDNEHFSVAGLGELKDASKSSPKVSFKGAKLTTRYSYFDNKKVSKMEARASREAQRGRFVFFSIKDILALTKTYVTLKILIFVLRLPSTLSKLILLVVIY